MTPIEGLSVFSLLGARRFKFGNSISSPGPVGAVCNRPIGVNFRKNNRYGPRAGRFGFLTEPDPTRKP